MVIRMNNTSFKTLITELLLLETKIIADHNDDEVQHITEDKMHMLFINTAHLLSSDEIVECQKIINRVSSMDFRRWCA